MQFGLYCPIPMATVGSPEVAQSAAEALSPLPAGQRDLQFEAAIDLLTAADKSGFNLCLFAERHLGHDIAAWVMASAVGSRLDNIRALTAVHPGLVDPVMIAKLAASLDRIVPKRMAINIVNGWFDEEFTMFGGKVLQGEERYERAVEFIDILRGLWTQETFTLHGKHYHVDNAQLLLKPASPTPPEIFSVSRSDRGRDFIADHCDWWFIDFPKEAETTEEVLRAIDLAVEDMNRRTKRSGRKVRYALNPFVALGTSRQDALEKAVQRILTTEKDPDPRKIHQRMLPATRAGCIGTPDEVRAQIRRFEELGIELILCKMIPTADNVRLLGREIIEPLAGDDRAVA
jgi:FMNH2-dependent dimethyl sulfone monooxygenase